MGGDSFEFGVEWIGLAVGGAVAFVRLMFLGYVRGGRPVDTRGERRARAGSLFLPALSTFLWRRRDALRILVIATVGGLAASLIALSTTTGSQITSEMVWIFVNALVAYFWHRAVLQDDVAGLGFPFHQGGGLIPLVGRFLGVGAVAVAVFIPLALLCGLPVLIIDHSVATVVGGAAFGAGAMLLAPWLARFSFALPATAVRQPSAGLREMHAWARGLGLPLAAALITVSIAAGAVGAILEETAWRLWSLTPETFDAYFDSGIGEILRSPIAVLSGLLVFNLPYAILEILYIMWSISTVSVAYRDWLLPQIRAGVATGGAPPGPDAA